MPKLFVTQTQADLLMLNRLTAFSFNGSGERVSLDQSKPILDQMYPGLAICVVADADALDVAARAAINQGESVRVLSR